MHEGAGACEDLGLRAVRVASVAGLIFVSLSDAAPDFADEAATYAAADVQGFATAKVAVHRDYLIEANWKLVWENNRECYHCDVNHPQYVRSNFDVAEAERDSEQAARRVAEIAARSEAYWRQEGISVKHARGGLATFPYPDSEAWYSATRTVLIEDYDSESMDGRRVAPLMGACQGREVGVLRLRGLPNFWCHASCDHAVLTRLMPAGLRRTAARVTWIVAGDAREGEDYQLERLLPFWQLTSEQDWDLCAKVQRGVDSSTYRPGPISKTREYNLEAFLCWYSRRLGAL
jgi:Rieske 2Fe-2S family protein